MVKCELRHGEVSGLLPRRKPHAEPLSQAAFLTADLRQKPLTIEIRRSAITATSQTVARCLRGPPDPILHGQAVLCRASSERGARVCRGRSSFPCGRGIPRQDILECAVCAIVSKEEHQGLLAQSQHGQFRNDLANDAIQVGDRVCEIFWLAGRCTMGM